MEHGRRVSDSAYRKLAQMFKKNLDIPVVKQRKTSGKKRIQFIATKATAH